MIAARPSPALKPERQEVLSVVQVAADLVEGRPLRLAGAAASPAVRRYQSDRIQRPTEATAGPIGATPTEAPGSAGGSAGGFQT